MLLVSFYTHENIRKPVVLFFRAYRKRPVARKKIRLILSQKGIMREQSCLKRKRKDFSFYTPWKHQKTYFQGVQTVKSGMKWVRYDFLFKMVQTQALNWPIKILQAFRYTTTNWEIFCKMRLAVSSKNHKNWGCEKILVRFFEKRNLWLNIKMD